ncbi:MAG: SPASM domain-containing protein [Planctomycetota bacterium]|nr:MAG: SPASM domain-containing protein [Planctomycetota bacterium]
MESAPAILPNELVVHAFEALGAKFAYFGKTGDIAKIDGDTFAVIRAYENGDSPSLEDAITVLPESKRAAMSARFAILAANGLLERQPPLSKEREQERVDRLFEHNPRNLMFLVTEACNLACTYCYEVENGVHDQPGTFKKVDAEKAIDAYLTEAAPRGYACITFFGGEPLLNFEVVKHIVAYSKGKAAELGMEVGYSITTNLTLMTEEAADLLASNHFSIMLSIDGPKHIHDRNRVGKCSATALGTHDLIIRNLKVLMEKCGQYGTRMPKLRATVTRPEEFEEVEDYLYSLGTGFVEIGTADFKEEDLDGPHCPSESPAKTKADPIREMEGRYEAVWERMKQGDRSDIAPSIAKGMRKLAEQLQNVGPREEAEPLLCGVCRNMKAITPNGDLYPCHRYVGMENFKVGNLHQGGLDEHRVRDYYGKVFESFRNKCSQCWARHLCGGQCSWELSTEDGEVGRPKDEWCRNIKRGLEVRLAMFAHSRELTSEPQEV